VYADYLDYYSSAVKLEEILRKIFGPVQNEDGSWRIRMNHELNELIANQT